MSANMSVSTMAGNFVTISAIILCVALNGSRVQALSDSQDTVITPSERDALDQLKPEVMELLTHDYMKTDLYLIRWLRASNLDVIVTQTKLNRSMIWRQENNIDDILTEDFSDMQDFPIWLDGHDKENRPLVAVDIGRWNLRGAVYGGKQERIERYMKFILEKVQVELVRTQQEISPNVTRAFAMIDASGMGYWQHFCASCVASITRWISVMEDNYPTLYDEIVVINTSSLSSLAMSIVRPFMSSGTVDMLTTFSYRRAKEWMAYLDEKVDSDQRYTNFGGTKPVYYLVYNNVLLLINYELPEYVYYPQSIAILPNQFVIANPI